MIIDPYTWRTFRIASTILVAEDTVAIRLEKPDNYTFRAGQYAVVRVTINNRSYIRQYSFSSHPADDSIELLIQKEPRGEVSSWFCGVAAPGDTIELSQAFGNFTPEKGKRPLLLIAGRIGIAPFMSIIRENKHKTHVLYSVRSRQQVCFAEELQTAGVSIVSTDHMPRIGTETLSPLLANNPVVYVCGSKQFVDAIVELLHKSGAAPKDIHRELFTLQ